MNKNYTKIKVKKRLPFPMIGTVLERDSLETFSMTGTVSARDSLEAFKIEVWSEYKKIIQMNWN